MTPRVSVVVPSYNNEAYIEQTVESILGQTYHDFELVIADHSSTDKTWRLLQRFADDSRVRLLSTEAGGGAERNWNRVTEAATGEFVKLVCGDDVLRPESLATQVKRFDDAGPGVVMVTSPRDIVDASGRALLRRVGLGGLDGVVAGRRAIRRSVLLGTNIFGEPCCVMMRRSTLAQVGGWHGHPGYTIDQATYIRLLLEGDLATTPDALAAFRISDTQWSVELTRQQSGSAAEMHRQLAARVPDLLTTRDVRVGNAMAALRAVQRRLVYLYLGRRMRRPSPAKRTDADGTEQQ